MSTSAASTATSSSPQRPADIADSIIASHATRIKDTSVAFGSGCLVGCKCLNILLDVETNDTNGLAQPGSLYTVKSYTAVRPELVSIMPLHRHMPQHQQQQQQQQQQQDPDALQFVSHCRNCATDVGKHNLTSIYVDFRRYPLADEVFESFKSRQICIDANAVIGRAAIESVCSRGDFWPQLGFILIPNTAWTPLGYNPHTGRRQTTLQPYHSSSVTAPSGQLGSSASHNDGSRDGTLQVAVGKEPSDTAVEAQTGLLWELKRTYNVERQNAKNEMERKIQDIRREFEERALQSTHQMQSLEKRITLMVPTIGQMEDAYREFDRFMDEEQRHGSPASTTQPSTATIGTAVSPQIRSPTSGLASALENPGSPTVGQNATSPSMAGGSTNGRRNRTRGMTVSGFQPQSPMTDVGARPTLSHHLQHQQYQTQPHQQQQHRVVSDSTNIGTVSFLSTSLLPESNGLGLIEATRGLGISSIAEETSPQHTSPVSRAQTTGQAVGVRRQADVAPANNPTLTYHNSLMPERDMYNRTIAELVADNVSMDMPAPPRTMMASPTGAQGPDLMQQLGPTLYRSANLPAAQAASTTAHAAAEHDDGDAFLGGHPPAPADDSDDDDDFVLPSQLNPPPPQQQQQHAFQNGVLGRQLAATFQPHAPAVEIAGSIPIARQTRLASGSVGPASTLYGRSVLPTTSVNYDTARAQHQNTFRF